MSANSKIEWCDATVNFWWGCTKVSPGCAHCYADSLSHRWGKNIWGKGKPRENHLESARKLALKLNRQAEREGRRLRVFCQSMSDWLDDEVPVDWLAFLLETVHATPNLDWLLLTKRPENWLPRLIEAFEFVGQDAEYFNKWSDAYFLLQDWLSEGIAHKTPANVWLGTSVEDQPHADERIPLLLQIPAKVRFLSCEPLLGKVLLDNGESSYLTCTPSWRQSASVIPPDCCITHSTQSEWREHPQHFHGIDWVICGGESGPLARPMHPDWARSLRDQCVAAGVPFFFKQWGEWWPVDQWESEPLRVLPDESAWDRHPAMLRSEEALFYRFGKKAAGRLLDGREWNEFPSSSADGLPTSGENPRGPRKGVVR